MEAFLELRGCIPANAAISSRFGDDLINQMKCELYHHCAAAAQSCTPPLCLIVIWTLTASPTLHLFPSLALVLSNDAAPLAVVLHALTINPRFYFCARITLLHSSTRLILARHRSGNRPREAAMRLKIDNQVGYRKFPLPALPAPSASQSSTLFPSFMNIYGQVAIWSSRRAKIRPQIKISPTSFPRCHLASIFFPSLSQEIEQSLDSRHDTRLFTFCLNSHTQ